MGETESRLAIEAEWASRRWKRIAGLALASSGVLLVALVFTLTLLLRPARQTDERLIGTWQSDADRTIADLRQRQPADDKQETALRKLFGKLRVTYDATTYTTELDGVTESSRYEVLGRDKHSVVVRDRKPSPLGAFPEWSEFTVIHFDGPDSYWLRTQIGGMREYFKRVR